MKRDWTLPSVLYWATWAALLCLPVLWIGVLLTGGMTRTALLEAFPLIRDPAVLSDTQVVGATAVGLVPWMFVVAILWQAQALFYLYRKGQALTAAAAGRIHAIGLTMVLLSPAMIVTATLQVLIVTASNPVGERALSVTFGWAEVGFLLAGGLMITIGRSMRDAAKAAEDLRGFV